MSEYERQYEGGREPRLLDVIDVPVLHAQPDSCQKENWLIDPDGCWEYVDRIKKSELPQFTDSVNRLWVNGYNTSVGLNNKVPGSRADSLADSLRLIKVERLDIAVFVYYSRRRVQGHFRYCGDDYKMWITDTGRRKKYVNRPDGHHSVGGCFLTISLGKRYDDGYCHKFIAAIIEP